MPLSEHEQRLLEQMERALYAEDPKFATSLRSTGLGRASRGRAALGVLIVLVGIGLLVGGMASQLVALGILGFVVMLLGAVTGYSAFRKGGEATAEGEQPKAPKPSKSSKGSFMDRVEDRWRRRQGEE